MSPPSRLPDSTIIIVLYYSTNLTVYFSSRKLSCQLHKMQRRISLMFLQRCLLDLWNWRMDGRTMLIRNAVLWGDQHNNSQTCPEFVNNKYITLYISWESINPFFVKLLDYIGLFNVCRIFSANSYNVGRQNFPVNSAWRILYLWIGMLLRSDRLTGRTTHLPVCTRTQAHQPVSHNVSPLLQLISRHSPSTGKLWCLTDYSALWYISSITLSG